ncbi:macrophage mannose receptor 1-like [Heptranchias perlo]|uniref:macrophage mannose receptor 1-like n=1 Tax=Heptranchias perlo TaxID=212740 RepID=UPI00355A7A87
MPANPSESGLSQVAKLSGREYHLIQEIKNWTDARDYCQSNYIDLISIRSPEEEKIIASLLEPDEWYWIGLYNDEQSSDGWKWTTGERINYTQWAPWYPKDFNITSPVCVYIKKDQWFNIECYFRLLFICYTEVLRPSIATEREDLITMSANLSESGLSQVTKLSGREYHLIQEIKNWTDARDYCQSNYIDLISIRSPEEEKVIASLLEPDEWYWIGLYNDEQSSDGWKWTTGERINYTHWAPLYPKDFNITPPVCVYMKQDQWFNIECYFRLLFICYTEVLRPSIATEPEDLITMSANLSESELLRPSIGAEPEDSITMPANPSESGLSQVTKLSGREYHLIQEIKNWTDARDYCQSNYIDLISIRSPEEEKVIASLLEPDEWYWIGLYNDEQSSDGWKWTTGERINYTHWAPLYPKDFNITPPVCVYMKQDQWFNIECYFRLLFICYTEVLRPSIATEPEDLITMSANLSESELLRPSIGAEPEDSITMPANPSESGLSQVTKLSGREYHLIQEIKNWTDARDYCQSNYIDLISIRSPEEEKVIASLLEPDEWYWIGLYNDEQSSDGWKWTTGERINYTQWAPWYPKDFNITSPVCVYIKQDQWFNIECYFRLLFICYTVPFFSLDTHFASAAFPGMYQFHSDRQKIPELGFFGLKGNPNGAPVS